MPRNPHRPVVPPSTPNYNHPVTPFAERLRQELEARKELSPHTP
jgi:hypothetical protein